jgi:hypothetical protein
MSKTPLSDTISAMLSRRDQTSFDEFIRVLVKARLGLVATGIPKHRRPGERFQVQPGDHIGMMKVSTPDGRTMLKACADPDAFARAFPDTKISALMVGHELLEMVAKSLELDGVLICSAASHHSVPVSRQDAMNIVEAIRKANA